MSSGESVKAGSAKDGSVTVTVKLDRPLWTTLRRVAEREPDETGRASVRGVILRALTREFSGR